MINEGEKCLIYFDDETHLVRRLGAAVIACWDVLPDLARRRLVEHAKRIMDEDLTDDIDGEIKRFIDDHTGMALMA